MARRLSSWSLTASSACARRITGRLGVDIWSPSPVEVVRGTGTSAHAARRRAAPARAAPLGRSGGAGQDLGPGGLSRAATSACGSLGPCAGRIRRPGSTGLWERGPDLGEVDGASGLFGNLVDEAAHDLEGGKDLPPDLLDRPHRVDRDQDP